MLLMKKDEIVADLNIAYGNIISVNKVFRSDLLPVGAEAENINEWWKNNAIPAERDSIRLGLECIGVESQEGLKTIGRGLSLLNQYWIKEADESITWEKQKTCITDYIPLKYEDLMQGLSSYAEMALKYSEMSRERIDLIVHGVIKRAHCLQKYLLSKNVDIGESCLIPESAL